MLLMHMRNIRISLPIIWNGLKRSVIHNTKLPHLIDVIWHASTQHHCVVSINVQAQTIHLINDPFVILKSTFHFEFSFTFKMRHKKKYILYT